MKLHKGRAPREHCYLIDIPENQFGFKFGKFVGSQSSNSMTSSSDQDNLSGDGFLLLGNKKLDERLYAEDDEQGQHQNKVKQILHPSGCPVFSFLALNCFWRLSGHAQSKSQSKAESLYQRETNNSETVPSAGPGFRTVFAIGSGCGQSNCSLAGISGRDEVQAQALGRCDPDSVHLLPRRRGRYRSLSSIGKIPSLSAADLGEVVTPCREG